MLLVFSLALAGCGLESNRTALPTPALPPQHSGWNRITLGGGGGQAGLAVHPHDPNIVYATTDNGGIVKTTNGGEQWSSINHNIGNRYLGDTELDPLDSEVLYVVAEVYIRSPAHNDDPVNGELYRTRDGGASWEVVYAEGMAGDGRCFGVTVWPSTRTIVIANDPSDPARYDTDGDRLSDVIYIGGWDDNDESASDRRGGVWKSTDEGGTFKQMGLNDQDVWVLRAHPTNPERLYAGTRTGGLFVSDDGGQTWGSWRDRIPLPTISDIVIDGPRGTLYVATNTMSTPYSAAEYAGQRGLYKSSDDGRTFSLINHGLEPTSLSFSRLLLDVTDPTGQTLITGPFDGLDKTMYRTTNGGANWHAMRVELRPSPSWFDEFENLWDLAQGADGTLYAATWNGLYRFNPQTQTWEIKVNGLGNIGIRRVIFEPGNDEVIYLGLLDSVPWKSTDRGRTWRMIGAGFVTVDGERRANASDFALSPANPEVVYAVGVGPSNTYLSAVLRSDNGGASWKTIADGLPLSQSGDPQWQANAIAVSARDAQRAWVALEVKSGDSQVYATTDGGQHWQLALTLPETPTDLAVSATEPETLVLATRQGRVYVSDDAGANWRSSEAAHGLVFSVDVFPGAPQRILLGVNIVGAMLSEDGGRTWHTIFDAADLQPFTQGLALSPFARERYYPSIRAVRIHPTDPNTFYLGHHATAWMSVGVLMTTDGGQTWQQLPGEDFQMRSVSSLDVEPQTRNLIVGTWEVYFYDTD
jgi:photosystem II stability/assembly factor-like uncharacterized protein